MIYFLLDCLVTFVQWVIGLVIFIVIVGILCVVSDLLTGKTKEDKKDG